MAPLPTWFPRTESSSHSTMSGLMSAGLSLLRVRDDLTSPFQTRQTQNLVKRTLKIDSSAGSSPASAFNNQVILGLFASIGAIMALAAMWFFFWAKNGGFVFEEGDWDDYKSTVLRRKGPDGRTLTNATKSTKLGGSTIAGTQHFKWAKQEARSVVGYDKKGRKGIMAKRGWGKTHSMTYTDDYGSFGTQTVSDEMTDIRTIPDPQHGVKGRHDRDVQDYKKEKPARVGGLNRVADGSHFGGTNTEYSDIYSEASDRPIINKDKERERERAERRAREEAARMERRWKKEAEEAAAALARESGRTVQQPRKSATPSKPSSGRQRASSRSASPKKRDFSYQKGTESEVLSTSYTGESSRRTTSYYDEYRPRASDSHGYASDHGNRSRQSSPKKKAPRSARESGYRRGADSDLD